MIFHSGQVLRRTSTEKEIFLKNNVEKANFFYFMSIQFVFKIKRQSNFRTLTNS